MRIALLLLLAVGAHAAKLPPPNQLSLVPAQCGRCGCLLDADCGTGGTCTTGVCMAGAVTRAACSTDAECATGQTCTPSPHRCSASFGFATGTATLKSSREPAPTCPKRGDPTENKSGDARLVGVTQNGAAYTGALTVEVLLKTTFGADPNGTCALAGVQIPFVGVTGALDCRAGKCRGALYAAACLPKECADTPITSEVVTVTVREPSGAALATPGIFLAPAASDAP